MLSLRPLSRSCCQLARLQTYNVLPATAPFHTTTHHPSTKKTTISRKQMPSRPKPPPESEVEESFLKGSGPGGQKINKTNSAVQIKHLPTNIVIKCQATRSRSQNRKIARDILAERLDELYNGAQSRSAVVGSVKKKRADSAAKKARRKHRKLAEEKSKAGGLTGVTKTEQGEGEGGEEEWEVVDEEYHEEELEETETQVNKPETVKVNDLGTGQVNESTTVKVNNSGNNLEELQVESEAVENKQPTPGDL